MSKIVEEKTKITVREVCDVETKKVVFYEKAIHYFTKYDDNSATLTIKIKKISKRTFEKLQKMLDKSKQV